MRVLALVYTQSAKLSRRGASSAVLRVLEIRLKYDRLLRQAGHSPDGFNDRPNDTDTGCRKMPSNNR